MPWLRIFRMSIGCALWVGLFALLLTRPAGAVVTQGTYWAGFRDTFGLPDGKTTPPLPYSVVQIASGATGNVYYPGDTLSFTYQFVNKTKAPISATGHVDMIEYATSTDPSDAFYVAYRKVADLGSTPISVQLDAGGYQDVTVTPPTPDHFGAYVLIVDLNGIGRQFGSAFIRTVPATPGKVQFPAFALDINPWNANDPALAQFFKRIGVKATRTEWSYLPTTDPNFAKYWAAQANTAQIMADNDISLMITSEAGPGNTQPLGQTRRWLDDKDTMVNSPEQGDMSWLPQYDDDYQKWVTQVAGTFGWPKGPVNAIELWNEPWEGISISGWGADIPRYRAIYTRMAQGIEAARHDDGTQVLIGGTCSSMNTDDKLFSDGQDTFLKWLDFTSIHYQPMAAWPALKPEWMNRQSPEGPVKVWDTETWNANSEDRVAALLASMRSTGLVRTAGVNHDMTYDVIRYKQQTADGVVPGVQVHAWAPAAAIAANQHLIGERTFKQLLFANGLPWVFEFNGLNNIDDDGALVVVGDLSPLYGRDRLLFRGVKGLSTAKAAAQIAALQGQMDALPAQGSAARQHALSMAIGNLDTLHDAAMTLPPGPYALYDAYANPIPLQNGNFVVPLSGHGYYLRPDGTPGSMAKLVAAVQAGRIEGLEPVDIVAHDMTAPIGGGAALRLTVTDVLNRPVTGTLSAALGKLRLTGAPQTVTLQPNQSREIILPVTRGKAKDTNVYPLHAVFDAGADGSAAHDEDMHVNLISQRTIKVDGDLGDWKGVLPQPFAATGTLQNQTERAWLPFMPFDQGTKGGQAVTYLAYDANNFYFAAKIADTTAYDGTLRFANRDDDSYFYPAVSYESQGKDHQGNPRPLKELDWPAGVRRFTYRKAPDIPSGDDMDNVQIAFGVFAPGQNGMLANPPGTMPRYMAYKSIDYEYALNPVAPQYGGGTEIWRLMAPGVPEKQFFPREPKAAIDGGPVTGGQLVMRRDGNTRIVEAALPWSEIPEVKKKLDAGEPIRFGVRVNDNGGPSYELAQGRSVSKSGQYNFHSLWVTSWANEVEFGWGK